MSEGPVADPTTQQRQQRASDPRASAWVSANAGSGKTKVLTDRVIRLMLAGSPPARILCLTFTKAAAAEMTVRVFGELGGWVTLDDRGLGDKLLALTGERPTAALKARARRLFARAVETPGGLKIETIHAFCERVLHLVPFEANVPPRFTVLDEGQSAELMTDARAAVLAGAASGTDRVLAGALDTVSSYVSGDALIQLVDGAVADPCIPGDPAEAALVLGRLARTLGVAPGETADGARRQLLDECIPPRDRERLVRALERGSSTDCEQADRLRAAFAAETGLELAVKNLRGVFCAAAGTPKASLATKKVEAWAKERLEEAREPFDAGWAHLLAVEALERTAALYGVAGAVRREAAALKRARGALDFADLIRRTRELLARDGADWVLYKLDRGIDHVLIDEAQDTNPEQWEILRRLTEEFTAGHGRPAGAVRTIFAVGDPKQSIFSFQGADPRHFEDNRRHWERQHAAAKLDFEHVRLDLSFRSAPAILGTVDLTFAVATSFKGLSFEDAVAGTAHTTVRSGAPGHVEIWPTEEPAEGTPDPDAWTLPVDEPDRGLPAVAVARRIANAVAAWTGTPDEATGRTWRPGEILILTRKRGPAFFACIRALKAAGIPVAGADRLDVGEQIAVNDLVAAGQAALLPENDLVLAAALKSPLVGLDDDDLIRVAMDRGDAESLAAALERTAEAGDERARIGWEALSEWRRLAREHGPFGFYATLLGPNGGRRRLVERLGGEAADAIDAFLSRAVAEESGAEAPSLTAFLHRFETSALVIKRDPEAPGDEVRVMTVHGAKGLEAPLVVVLDGCDVLGPDPKLIPVPIGPDDALVPVWAPGSTTDPPPVAAARAAVRERALEEHNRLLYVALTRARDRLVIAPFTNGRNQQPEEAWCKMVRRGFDQAVQDLVRTETSYGPVDLWRDGASAPAPARTRPAPRLLDLPAWLGMPVDPEARPAPPLRPSGALGRPERPPTARAGSRPRAEARRHGNLVHALIDRLAGTPPGASRTEAALGYLAGHAAEADASIRASVLTEAERVLDHPELAALFGPGSRGEAAIAGRIGLAGADRAVSGQIDRLLVGPDGILLADFKTGASPAGGSVPEEYLAQLALYRALLAKVHPGRPVRTLLVWTEGPRIVEPTGPELDRAMSAALGLLS